MTRVEVPKAESCLEALDNVVEAIELVAFHQTDLCPMCAGIVVSSFARQGSEVTLKAFPPILTTPEGWQHSGSQRRLEDLRKYARRYGFQDDPAIFEEEGTPSCIRF